MSYLKELLERSFEVFCKKRWLKVISKEVEKRNKLMNKAEMLKRKANIKEKVVKDLVKQYNNTFYKEGEADVKQ